MSKNKYAKDPKTIKLDAVDIGGTLQVLLPEARIESVAEHKKDVTTAPFDPTETQGYPWAPWGSNDRLPTDIRKKIEQVPMASVAINKKAQMMYGNGLAYYKNSDLLKGEGIKRAYTPKIEDWLKRNHINTRCFIPHLLDFRYNMQTFSEFVLNGAGDQITGMYYHSGEHCRLGKQNERSYDIEQLFLSPKFGTGQVPTDSDYKTLPLYRFYDEAGFFKKMRSKRNFAYHSLLRTPGVTYYARAFWLALFKKDGWIDAAISVPKIVNAMMKNQVRLKYQILIPDTYFSIRHSDWDNIEVYTDVKRQAVIEAFIKKINAELQNTDNQFASIATVFKQDEQTGTDIGKIEILAVDDKIKKDSWVPSSTAADAQIIQGLGLHPSQVGLAPEGGKMGAGSGSDQRESFNTDITLNTMDQQIVLEPYNYAARYNAMKDPDWDVTFFIPHTSHTTTNDQEDGLVKDVNTIDPE